MGCLDFCGECLGWCTLQLSYLLLGITYLIVTGGYALGATYVGYIVMRYDLLIPERMVLLSAPSGSISLTILGGIVLAVWYATKSENDGSRSYYKGAWFAWLAGNALSGAGAGILGWLFVRGKVLDWPGLPNAGTATLGALVGFLVVCVPAGFLGAIIMYFRAKRKAKKEADTPPPDVEYGLVGETEAGKLEMGKPMTTLPPLPYPPPRYPPPPPAYRPPIVQEY